MASCARDLGQATILVVRVWNRICLRIERGAGRPGRVTRLVRYSPSDGSQDRCQAMRIRQHTYKDALINTHFFLTICCIYSYYFEHTDSSWFMGKVLAAHRLLGCCILVVKCHTGNGDVYSPRRSLYVCLDH